MPSLLLQRTSKKSKSKENKNHLERRLKLWEEGKYDQLLEEGEAIQNRLNEGGNNNQQSGEGEFVKQFRAQMSIGNVNGALRLLGKSGSSGVLPINDETILRI